MIEELYDEIDEIDDDAISGYNKDTPEVDVDTEADVEEDNVDTQEINNIITMPDGKTYALEKKLVKKLRKIIERTTQAHPKLDALIVNEGPEGEGKTNTSIVEAWFAKQQTGRDVHLFFKLEPMMKFAQETEKQIIIWDEPSLDSLSTDQLSTLNKDMQRLFMTVRKKRHIFIINYTKFWKFPEYIVVDRATCMIHMYTRKGKEAGRFVYIKKRKLEQLWNDFHRSKKRTYFKLKSFGGRFPDIMEKHFSSMGFFVGDIANATYEDYEKEKDKAIKSIGVSKKSKKELFYLKHLNKARRVAAIIMKESGLDNEKIAKLTGVRAQRLREWQKIEEDDVNFVENGDFYGEKTEIL